MHRLPAFGGQVLLIDENSKSLDEEIRGIAPCSITEKRSRGVSVKSVLTEIIGKPSARIGSFRTGQQTSSCRISVLRDGEILASAFVGFSFVSSAEPRCGRFRAVRARRPRAGGEPIGSGTFRSTGGRDPEPSPRGVGHLTLHAPSPARTGERRCGKARRRPRADRGTEGPLCRKGPEDRERLEFRRGKKDTGRSCPVGGRPGPGRAAASSRRARCDRRSPAGAGQEARRRTDRPASGRHAGCGSEDVGGGRRADRVTRPPAPQRRS